MIIGRLVASWLSWFTWGVALIGTFSVLLMLCKARRVVRNMRRKTKRLRKMCLAELSRRLDYCWCLSLR